jgi:GT2 family glycosyltransferase
MLYGSEPPIETYLVFNYVGHVFSKSIEWEPKNARVSCDIEVATGCCFLIKKSVLQRIGSFDEYFHRFSTRFFYSSLEDNDLSWRTQLAGYRILYEPESVIYHKYEQKPLVPLRYYYLECGRLYTMLKNYDWKTLLIIFPAFVVSEIMGWGYLLIKGPEFIKEKFRAMVWLFNSFGLIKLARLMVLIHRRTSDVTILSRFQADTEIRHVNWPPIIRRAVEIPINTFFRGWKMITLSLLKSLDKHLNSPGSS